jgi:hypothetical protein
MMNSSIDYILGMTLNKLPKVKETLHIGDRPYEQISNFLLAEIVAITSSP